MPHPFIRKSMLAAGLVLAGPVSAAPLFLGEQEVPEDTAGAAQQWCQELDAEARAGSSDTPDPNQSAEAEQTARGERGPLLPVPEDQPATLADAFITPPDGLGDVGSTDGGGAEGASESGAQSGFELSADGEGNGFSLEDVTLEDCKAAGLIF
ncbi:hypothetical protein [Pelagibacterium montanilacus]|uniref:hypothetical protein n=1 Tax=Pelagibacterium montanilacus TaxID=2185280 RepID=UPI000F8C46A8|nr:hypothetical protein [Pelagibacterium montanilacus]